MTPDEALSRAGADDMRGTFITVLPERARREASASAARRRAGAAIGPLDGVPVVWKDNFDVEGTVTTNGSLTRRAAPVASSDASAVATLASAGAVCLGKTNLSEFAFTGLGLNPHFGNPVNPVAPDRVPGGSSSGSSVAVAAGIAAVGMGSDTSGSIRVPAAFCGIVGYRPSVRRYDRGGMVPLSPQLDSVGVLAKSLDLVRAVDATLAAAQPGRPATTIVIPEGELVEDCAPQVTEAFDAAVNALVRAGFPVLRRRIRALEDMQHLIDEHGSLTLADAYRAFGHLRGSTEIDPLVARRLTRHNPAHEVVRAALPALTRRLESEVDESVVVFPTVRVPAPTVASVADVDSAEVMNRKVLRSTMLTSHLDMPGVAMGNVLLSATSGRDDTLLATAAGLERFLLPRTTPREVSR
ncbi:amidase family protein [Actinophytocola algeriensis]|uniref:Aspartyl-tRNA(Asn)/glutamyl-tRNA(Gln) amidotransferase subunit A n=1 Tax=Actinophytocola algeriensis TaxID=1768010 RepID=A0A7W7Q7W4_9PSEU|nr:amidase family protein [Actinophytocola algeriensis]MBB4908261.1 aspartyl-tRNA(Asn)/glutamyl-tRNA(Gln) amidotransferase subunit A [Actinophytocola algeriensis]MBE1480291.1 aspartyl-tRNA(Asn)/glutamyl-tRNA(Gln) amidotransferase subunit A [Actinophytocola algeriensis]